MENEIFDKILQLIIEKRGKYKFPITEKTTLEGDLGIPLFSGKNILRNINTAAGRVYVGSGNTFQFQFYGEGIINDYPPTPSGLSNYPGINLK